MIDISKTELEVMQAIWKKSPVSSAEIVQTLNRAKEWHEKTVKTLLGRLVKKHALGFIKEGRQYQYYPLIEESDYQEQAAQSFISRLFNGRVSPLIAGFAKQEKLSKDDVEQLKQFIAEWEQDND